MGFKALNERQSQTGECGSARDGNDSHEDGVFGHDSASLRGQCSKHTRF